MATREINLITSKRAASNEEVRLRRIVYFSTTAVLIIFMLVLVGFYGFSIYTASQLTRTEQEIVQTRSQIASLSNAEVLYRLLKQKLTGLQKISATRFNYIALFEFFKSLAAEGILIESVEIEDTSAVTITVNTPNSAALEHYVQALLKEASTRFSQVELVSVEYEKDANYAISLNISPL